MRRGCWLTRLENGRFPGGRTKPSSEAAKPPESPSGNHFQVVRCPPSFLAGGMLRGLSSTFIGISKSSGWGEDQNRAAKRRSPPGAILMGFQSLSCCLPGLK